MKTNTPTSRIILSDPKKQQTRKYKKVIIVGKDIDTELYKKEKGSDTVIINSGDDYMTSDALAKELQKQRNNIDKNAVFLLNIHGNDTKKSKGEYEPHNYKSPENTQNFIQVIKDIHSSINNTAGIQDCLTKIILASCFAGTVQHANIPQNTLIFALGTQYHYTSKNTLEKLNVLNAVADHNYYVKTADILIKRAETTYIIKQEGNDQLPAIKKLRRPKTVDLSGNRICFNSEEEVRTNFNEKFQAFRSIFPLDDKDIQGYSPEEIKEAQHDILFNNIYKNKYVKLDDLNKIDINYQDKNKQNILHIISSANNIKTLKKLINKISSEQMKSLLSIKDNNGNTPLHIASYHGHHETVKALMESLDNEQIVEVLSIQNKKGTTPLYLASQEGHHEIVTTLTAGLREEIKKELLSIKNNQDATPLYIASQNGHDKTVTILMAGLNSEQIERVLSRHKEQGKRHYEC